MDLINHPISGEKGYFCSEKDKILIDAILSDFENKHLVTTSHFRSGVLDE